MCELGQSARLPRGQPIAVRKVDKTTWHLSGAATGAEIEYEIFADQSGPFGAQLNSRHAFFNLAEILMYPVDGRLPARNLVRRSPRGLADRDRATPSSGRWLCGANYDRLVDSPVELGTFQESDFDQGGGHYRVVVDADPGDYDMQRSSPRCAAWCRQPPPGWRTNHFKPICSSTIFRAAPEAAAWSTPTRTAIDVNASGWRRTRNRWAT